MVQMLLWNVPLGLVLLAGFGLSVRNFFRHGRSARIALFGYLFVLMWLSTRVTLLTLMVFPPTNPANWDGLYSASHSVVMALQSTAPPLGYALLTWAVLAGRRATDARTPTLGTEL